MAAPPTRMVGRIDLRVFEYAGLYLYNHNTHNDPKHNTHNDPETSLSHVAGTSNQSNRSMSGNGQQEEAGNRRRISSSGGSDGLVTRLMEAQMLMP